MVNEVDKRRNELIAREAKKPGFKGKLAAKCIECIYDPSCEGCGNWRQQVAACTDTQCPLYSVRPLSKPQPAKVQGNVIETRQ